MDGQNAYSFNRLVIAAYRVPFRIVKRRHKTELVQNSGGLVSAILALSQRMEAHFSGNVARDIVWVGHSEHSKEEFAAHASRMKNFDVHPVSMDPKVHRNYYNGFCNATIWPLFHYFRPSRCSRTRRSGITSRPISGSWMSWKRLSGRGT